MNTLITILQQILEDAEKDEAEWIVPKDGNLTRSYDATVLSNVVNFITSSQFDSSITLQLDHVLDLVLSIDLMFRPNTSLMITLQNRETKKSYNLFYIVADLMLSVQVIN